MKQSKFRRMFKVLIIAMVWCSFLFGCGQKLSPDFDEQEIEDATQEVILLLNENNTDEIRERCNVELRNALTDDVLAQVYAIIAEGGAYKTIEELSIAGTKDDASGEEFAMVVANAQYEIKMFTYTISFTKQMKLAGLFIK